MFILNIPSINGNISHWHHPTQPPLLGGRERGLLQAPPPAVCAALATTALGLASRGEKPGRPTSHDLNVIGINVTYIMYLIRCHVICIYIYKYTVYRTVHFGCIMMFSGPNHIGSVYTH